MRRLVRRLRSVAHRRILFASPVWRLMHRVLGLQRPLARRSVGVDGVPPHVGHALVLGAKVRADGSVSEVLRERLDRAAEIARSRPDLIIIVSGDGRSSSVPEDRTMRDELVLRDVAPERIQTDPRGFSTRETMARARERGVLSAVIVTNDFHVARAIHVAVMMGIDAYAVDDYVSRSYTDADRPLRLDERRELVAHLKDWGVSVLGRG